ncbi:unnamed protein product, partial [Mesorhabditis belari]|uniref:Polymerase nucleotidyl transferase domain-containing protein n=1 Tax=Mesorhabditis belari TaxID=2138241 RepID=A0AAF3EX08_9BILA
MPLKQPASIQIADKIISTTTHPFRSKCGELLPFLRTEFPRQLHDFEKRFYKKEYRVDLQLLQKRRSLMSQVCAALTHQELKAVPCGSIASGLMTSNSDLDAVVIPFDEKRFFDRYEKDLNFKRKQLARCHRKLLNSNLVRGSFTEFIPWARVPIVRMVLKTGDHLDVQFHDARILKSTNFIRVANNLDHRLFMLRIHLFKTLTENGLLASQEGRFSSFHVTSLLIHFLQVPFFDCAVYPPLLSTFPDLQPGINWKTIAYDVATNRLYQGAESFEKSMDSLGALYVRLIDYFSGINFHEDALDISNGSVVKKDTISDQVELRDAYFPETSTCRVQSGASLLSNFFATQRERIEAGKLT